MLIGIPDSPGWGMEEFSRWVEMFYYMIAMWNAQVCVCMCVHAHAHTLKGARGIWLCGSALSFLTACRRGSIHVFSFIITFTKYIGCAMSFLLMHSQCQTSAGQRLASEIHEYEYLGHL